MKKLTSTTLSIFGLLMATNSSVMACNSCMGAAGSDNASALSASILLLLAILTVVGSFFLGFVFFLAKRDGLPIPQEQV